MSCDVLVMGGNVFGGVRAGGGVEGVQLFACITDSGEGVVEGCEHGAEFPVDGFAVAAELGVETAVLRADPPIFVVARVANGVVVCAPVACSASRNRRSPASSWSCSSSISSRIR